MLDFKGIAKLFEEIELKLIASLKRNLHRHRAEESKEGFNWSAWQAEKLKNLEKFRRENINIINEYIDIIDNETHELMEEQFREGEELVNSQFENLIQENHEADKTSLVTHENFFGVNEKRMKSLIEDITNLEFRAETAALRMTDDVYRTVLNRVQLEMAAGSTTLTKAIDDAVKEFLEKGINCIVYKDGRRVNIADYVRMALRTTATRANLQGQAKRFAELGYDTVMTSQYSMCSDTCLPYQGKVYIDDVFIVWCGEINGDYGKSNYCGKWFMLLSVAVKNGLFHPNCQHTILQYIDGITKLPEPIDSKEDLKKYRLEQKQREMERTIRKLKRLKEGTFDSVTAEAYGKQLRDAQKKLREFINVVNEDYKNKILVRDSSREKVYNVKVDKIEKSGMIKVDKVIFGHENAPKKYLPNAVIDHINSEDKVSIRTFYDDNSMKLKDIHTTNHGNPKTHNYGINGEHAHDYEWNKDGILKNKTTRELTDLERKDNEDIL